MTKVLIALMLSLVLTSLVNGQSPQASALSQNELNALLGRTLGMIEIVLMESEMSERQEMRDRDELDEPDGPNGPEFLEPGLGPQSLDVAPYQQQQIRDLTEEINDVLTVVGEGPAVEARVELAKRLQGFEKELNETILLPIQAKIVNGRVFASLLSSRGGDYLRTVEECYSDKVKLNQGQKEKLKDITSRSKKQMVEAAKKYRSELKKVAEKSNCLGSA